VAVSAMGNGGWGFLDESFLGNTYVGCHTENNKKGGYSVTNPNARSLFIGSYTEGGQPANNIAWPSTVVGGFFGPRGTGYFLSDGIVSPNWSVRNQKDPQLTTTLSFAADVPRGVLSLAAADGSLPYRLEYQKTGKGWWDLNYGEAATGTVMSFSTGKSDDGFGQVRFPNGIQISWGANARKINAGARPPTNGSFHTGDIFFSTDPARTGYVGWVAVKSGSPGEWVPFGTLARTQISALGQTASAAARLQATSFGSASGMRKVVFDAVLGTLQKIMLHHDVIESELLHLTPAARIDFLVCQDAFGGHAFRWPQNVRGGMRISGTAGNCSAQSFVSDGNTAFATTPGMVSENPSARRQ